MRRGPWRSFGGLPPSVQVSATLSTLRTTASLNFRIRLGAPQPDHDFERQLGSHRRQAHTADKHCTVGSVQIFGRRSIVPLVQPHRLELQVQLVQVSQEQQRPKNKSRKFKIHQSGVLAKTKSGVLMKKDFYLQKGKTSCTKTIVDPSCAHSPYLMP